MVGTINPEFYKIPEDKSEKTSLRAAWAGCGSLWNTSRGRAATKP